MMPSGPSPVGLDCAELICKALMGRRVFLGSRCASHHCVRQPQGVWKEVCSPGIPLVSKMRLLLGASVLIAVPAGGCKSRLLLHWSGNRMDTVPAHLCPVVFFRALLCQPACKYPCQPCQPTGNRKQWAAINREIKRSCLFSKC